MSQYYNQVSYGLTQPLITEAPKPIVALRAPTTHDINYALGTLWIQPKNTSSVAVNFAWVLTSIINNSASWLQIETGGGTGVFTALTVTGVSTLTGTTNINITGAATTNIGNGGTGAVNIGNATGGVSITGATGVTGTLTASTGLIATTGGVTATAGNIDAADGNIVLGTAGTYISMPGPVFIYSGAGAPANGLALHVGDMYINTTAASATTRLYIATAASTWTNITCAA